MGQTGEGGDARNKNKKRKNLRRNLRYYLLALPLIAVFTRLPLCIARRIGWLGGTIAWVFSRTSRSRAMENLERVWGKEKSPAELRRICRGVFRNTAINVCEMAAIFRWPIEKIRRVFPYDERLEGYKMLNDHPAVAITGHFGNWELLGYLAAVHMPGRVVPIVRRIYFPKFQELVERFRTKVGMEVVYTDESPRRVLRVLREGKIVAILPDQDLKVVNGEFVDFFGREAYTSTTPVHLALNQNVPLSTLFLIREGWNYRVLGERVELSRTGSRDRDLVENTQRWTRVFEAAIRRHPDQWVWFHRRWRTRPEDLSRRTVTFTERSARRKERAEPSAPAPGGEA